jgi:hypothetical protein
MCTHDDAPLVHLGQGDYQRELSDADLCWPDLGCGCLLPIYVFVLGMLLGGLLW